MSNTHDQIHYNNNISNARGHIKEYPIQICSIYESWGQIHLYLTVYKYLYKYTPVFVFDVRELKVFVVNYFSKVFDIFKYFQILLQIRCQYQYFVFKVTCNACQTDYLHCNFTQ